MAKTYNRISDNALEVSETVSNTITVVYTLKELRAKKQAIKDQIDSYQREKLVIDDLIAKCLELNVTEA